MRRSEWMAATVTLPLVVALSVVSDAAVGFASGLAAFPVLVRGADALLVYVARPAPVLRRRASALDG